MRTYIVFLPLRVELIDVVCLCVLVSAFGSGQLESYVYQLNCTLRVVAVRWLDMHSTFRIGGTCVRENANYRLHTQQQKRQQRRFIDANCACKTAISSYTRLWLVFNLFQSLETEMHSTTWSRMHDFLYICAHGVRSRSDRAESTAGEEYGEIGARDVARTTFHGELSAAVRRCSPRARDMPAQKRLQQQHTCAVNTHARRVLERVRRRPRTTTRNSSSGGGAMCFTALCQDHGRAAAICACGFC